jgi:type II secretory pathway pseudopilin PulG
MDTRRGYSFIELALALSIVMTMMAMTLPPVLASLDDVRTAAAARYVSARLYEARLRAVLESADVAFAFVKTGGGYEFRLYVDGNHNGVRTRDIAQGADSQLEPVERLSDQFGGVDFGAFPGVPPIDAGGAPPGADPIRLGASDLLTFSPLGTSSSGTLYIRGRRSAQYAIRILGQTGRTRIVRCDVHARSWRPA